MPMGTGSKRAEPVPGGSGEDNVRRMRPLPAKTEQRRRAHDQLSFQELRQESRSGKLRKAVL